MHRGRRCFRKGRQREQIRGLHVVFARHVFDGIQHRRILYECQYRLRHMGVVVFKPANDRVFIRAGCNRRNMPPMVQSDGIVIGFGQRKEPTVDRNVVLQTCKPGVCPF